MKPTKITTQEAQKRITESALKGTKYIIKHINGQWYDLTNADNEEILKLYQKQEQK